MKLTSLLIIISVGLFLYLFVESCSHIDIAATINNGEVIRRQSEIEKFTDIEVVKTIAKKSEDQIRQNFRSESRDAEKRLLGLIILFAIQIIIWRYTNKNHKEGNIPKQI